MLAQDAQVERLRPSIVIARRPTAVRLPCMAAKGIWLRSTWRA